MPARSSRRRHDVRECDEVPPLDRRHGWRPLTTPAASEQSGEGGPCIRGDECDPGASLVCDTDTIECIADTSVYELTCSGAAALLK